MKKLIGILGGIAIIGVVCSAIAGHNNPMQEQAISQMADAQLHRQDEITKQAAKELAITNEVEYITDIQQILNMGLMSSPILAVDGKPAFVGFVPNVEEIKKAIQKTATK